MKRVFLIFTLLFASVLTTACINNFAVQELNNKAKEYLDEGKTEKAICRYKSSLDLDSSIFETHYNLGVAYISAKEYDEAVETLKAAIKINSEIADTYYSLGVALENIAFDKIDGDLENEEDTKKELTNEQKEELSGILLESIDNYNQYLAHNSQAKDKDKVIAHIEELNKELIKYSTKEEDKD